MALLIEAVGGRLMLENRSPLVAVIRKTVLVVRPIILSLSRDIGGKLMPLTVVYYGNMLGTVGGGWTKKPSYSVEKLDG